MIASRTRRDRRSPARLGALALAAAVTLLGLTPSAQAWEPATTHAGLAEQSASASRLHDHLVKEYGLPAGVLETVAIPPADAPPLFEVLRRLNPTHGYAPDNRGQLSVIGWLAAGAVIADSPQPHAANHFYDPASQRGLGGHSISGLAQRIREAVFATWHRTHHVTEGMAAPQWILAADNPMNLAAFYDQLERATAAATPAERGRHLAAAMLAAGALLHVLHDLGSPSHVRDDFRAHLDRVGADPRDRGARHERVAALAWGRIGVPSAREVPVAGSLMDLFTGNDTIAGLAAATSRSWFSAYTLPRVVELGAPGERAALKARIAASAQRPEPAPPLLLDLLGARSDRGARFENDAGICLARYRIVGSKLSWYTDDDCSLEQLPAQLATAAGYGAGLLNWLLRGKFSLAADGVKANIATGAGTLTFYAEDSRGVRAAVGAPAAVAGGDAGVVLGALPSMPEGTTHLAVLFSGVGGNGERLIIAARRPYPLATP